MIEDFRPSPTSSATASAPVTTLTLEALETIRRHGAETFPDECCGALIAIDGVVVEAYRMENTTGGSAARRFRIGPDGYRLADKRAREVGGSLAGLLPFASERAGAAVGVRPRARLAQSDVCHHFCSGRRAGGHHCLAPARRPVRIRRGRVEMAGLIHRVLIPTPLRPFTGQQDAVEVEGGTVGEALASLTRSYGDLRRHLYADDGKLRHFVNVYVNDDDIRYLDKDATKLKDGDVISIVPSVAGGAPVAGVPATPRTTTETAPELSNAEIQRYSRHLILPEVGLDGQKKLKAGKVLCVGAGGLGSPAALYLAAAGVGTIGIIDFDAVDESNLQRQILHGTPDVGRSKLQSAQRPPDRAEPRGAHQHLRDAADVGERARAVPRLRRHPRRHRQLRHPLSRQRRLRAARHSQRLRQHLPLRGAGVGVRDQGRPVLPLPLS